jgi:hypothetical protein
MIFIIDKPGQLGNRLFIFSNLISFSNAFKIPLIYPAFDDYCEFFNHTCDNLLCQYPNKSLSIYSNSKKIRSIIYHSFLFCARVLLKLKKFIKDIPFVDVIELGTTKNFNLNDPAFVKKARKKHIFLLGWLFRDNEHLKEYTDEIRKIFIPIEPYKSNIDKKIVEARKKGDILIGVHIRRGDYKRFCNGLYYYETNVYLDYMSKIVSLFKDKQCCFLICSDEPLSEKMFQNYNVTIGSGFHIEDLFAFSKCDYLIGPPSTFTMWASFYGNVPLFQIRTKKIKRELRTDQFKIIDC